MRFRLGRFIEVARHQGGRGLILAWACSFAPPAIAEAPPFDRPGISFAPGLTPRGSVSFEQGLPDFATDRIDGVRSTTYTADSNLRIGLSDRFELQVAGDLYNLQRVSGDGESVHDHGGGDTRLGLKAALPALAEDFKWSALGSVTLATGESPFTNGHTQYDLGVAATQESGEITLGLYVDAARLDGETSWTLAPNASFECNDRVGAFAEIGLYRNGGAPNESVAGGGLTFMLTPSVQLDLSADVGLDHRSPDLVGGFGFSVLLPVHHG